MKRNPKRWHQQLKTATDQFPIFDLVVPNYKKLRHVITVISPCFQETLRFLEYDASTLLTF